MKTNSGEHTARPKGSSLRWTLSEGETGATVVEFAGEINENAELAPLKMQLRGDVVFRLDGITRINSCGVREWVRFVRDLPQVDKLRFSHCSPAIVNQLNTIYNFRGGARVRSLMAPYVCERCGIEEYKLIELDERISDPARLVPSFNCPRCQSPMEFDDLPERYLSFLKEA